MMLFFFHLYDNTSLSSTQRDFELFCLVSTEKILTSLPHIKSNRQVEKIFSHSWFYVFEKAPIATKKKLVKLSNGKDKVTLPEQLLIKSAMNELLDHSRGPTIIVEGKRTQHTRQNGSRKVTSVFRGFDCAQR